MGPNGDKKLHHGAKRGCGQTGMGFMGPLGPMGPGPLGYRDGWGYWGIRMGGCGIGEMGRLRMDFSEQIGIRK